MSRRERSPNIIVSNKIKLDFLCNARCVNQNQFKKDKCKEALRLATMDYAKLGAISLVMPPQNTGPEAKVEDVVAPACVATDRFPPTGKWQQSTQVMLKYSMHQIGGHHSIARNAHLSHPAMQSLLRKLSKVFLSFRSKQD